ALSAGELRDIEDLANQWSLDSRPVRALNTTRKRAEELGAIALFGEKYGDEVRMIEVEAVSRELCGGTHVGVTSEIGSFKIVSEGSSAANVRRIEVITGPEAINLLRGRDQALTAVANRLRVPPESVVEAVDALIEEKRELEASRREAGGEELARRLAELVDTAQELDGVKVVAAACGDLEREALLDLSDRVKSSLGHAAVVLGTAAGGRPHLVANFSKS